MNDLSGLNDEQRAAAADVEGAVLVTAGAGSGKTRMLTHRIAYLIENKGVSPYHILAITFTNKAAKEMRDRLLTMTQDGDRIWISTFHSMCVRILRKFIDKIGYKSNFSIYGEDEKARCVKKLIKKLRPDCEDADALYKNAVQTISWAKNDGYTPDEYYERNKYNADSEVLRDIYCGYENELKDSNALDYDDLLNKALLLLRSDAEAREFYQEKFQYIHVDEFQDTNKVQYEIVRILADKYRNIFVVGDEDQCIYGWRGANIRNINDYRKDFDCKVYKLERNYRSTKRILSLANMLIQNNTSRIEKNLWTDATEGAPPELITATNEWGEAEAVVAKINQLIRAEGYKYSDFAVLMRLNALSRSFEERMMQYGIPAKVYGGFKFFERKEVKDLLAYLRVLANPLDGDAIRRIINFPKRGIGDGTVAQLFDYADRYNKLPMEVILTLDSHPAIPSAAAKKIKTFAELMFKLGEYYQSCTPAELLINVVEALDLKGLYSEQTEENINRLMHIDELIQSLQQYERANPGCSLEDYLQMITLYSDLDEMDEGNNCVSLATVHSAKGLEFKVVFIVGLEDGIFPGSRAMSSLSEEEEERRLMYVAITRAKERLYMTRALRRFLYGQYKDSMPSRFLKELGVTCEPKPRSVSGTAAQYRTESRSYQSECGTPDEAYRPAPLPTAQRSDTVQPELLRPGTRVRHKKFGEGVVVSLVNEHSQCYAEIEFQKVGKINLSVAFAPLTIID